MANYDGYNIVDSEGEVIFTVWWDGHKLCSKNKEFLKSLQHEAIDGHVSSDGEKFFKSIPKKYGNGYVNTHKIRVDHEGNEIKTV